MKRFFALLLCIAPVQAGALSCLPHDPLRTFHELSQAPETYNIATGMIAFDKSRLPQTDTTGQPPSETVIPATFTGHALSRNGFNTAFTRKIDLRVQCFAHWCGGLETGSVILAFVERGKRDRITIDPCGGHAFPNPTRKQLRQMQSCISGGPCPKPKP